MDGGRLWTAKQVRFDEQRGNTIVAAGKNKIYSGSNGGRGKDTEGEQGRKKRATDGAEVGRNAGKWNTPQRRKRWKGCSVRS